ncbi:unnamed protein product [Rotaria sp. Silwood2]|nr:unnamed protein product [Rotaria sp. Silwood2]
MYTTPSDYHSITGKRKAGDDFDFKQSARFHPYTITFKKPQQNEHLISEWKNKNDYILNITGRFGHEKCLLIFANDETSSEELFNQLNWPTKINDIEFDIKIPRVSPSIYSLVIEQFFNNWNIENIFQDLKTLYPTLIKLTRMYSFNNKPLNLVRADFCSLQQVRNLLEYGRITISHMKNFVKQYHPPAKINKYHPYNNSCQNEIKCVNCGQDHYAGHSACPEVLQIRRQINQNQKEKRAQLLINLEQDQHNHYFNNNQSFPPLMSASTHHQQQFEERLISQVIEVEKKVDNIKNVANELETIIFETILPAIKAIQECSFINT